MCMIIEACVGHQHSFMCLGIAIYFVFVSHTIIHMKIYKTTN
jgi:hypothetical protein